MNRIQVEKQIDEVAILNSLKVSLTVAEQQQKYASDTPSLIRPGNSLKELVKRTKSD